MTHIFNVTTEVLEALQGQRRHLMVKDSAKYATGDTALIQAEDSEHREQITLKIISVDHGPVSKHVNGHYCLLGLFAPYTSVDDLRGVFNHGDESHD